MSSFTALLIVMALPDGRLWRLMAPFAYHVRTYPSDDVITVPDGFETDFASVPRILWWLIPPTGRYGKACVVHDWLYVTKTRPRIESDAIFLEAMEVLGVPRWKRLLMWLAVRMAGGPRFFRDWPREH